MVGVEVIQGYSEDYWWKIEQRIERDAFLSQYNWTLLFYSTHIHIIVKSMTDTIRITLPFSEFGEFPTLYINQQIIKLKTKIRVVEALRGV